MKKPVPYLRCVSTGAKGFEFLNIKRAEGSCVGCKRSAGMSAREPLKISTKVTAFVFFF
jgi:hypothetical protein